jgi:hypothetical protein
MRMGKEKNESECNAPNVPSASNEATSAESNVISPVKGKVVLPPPMVSSKMAGDKMVVGPAEPSIPPTPSMGSTFAWMVIVRVGQRSGLVIACAFSCGINDCHTTCARTKARSHVSFLRHSGTQSRARAHTHTHARTHTRTRTHTHIHTHTHTHTHSFC